MANEKWYFLVVNNFDPQHRVEGPCEDENSCISSMMADAENEHRIGLEEGQESELVKSEDIGEAELSSTVTMASLWLCIPTGMLSRLKRR